MRRLVLNTVLVAILSGCAWTPNVNILGTLQPSPSDVNSYVTILTPLEDDVLIAESVIVAGRANALDTKFEWRIEQDDEVIEVGTIVASASSPEVGVFILDLRELELPQGRYVLFIEQKHKISNQVKLQDSVEFRIN